MTAAFFQHRIRRSKVSDQPLSDFADIDILILTRCLLHFSVIRAFSLGGGCFLFHGVGNFDASHEHFRGHPSFQSLLFPLRQSYYHVICQKTKVRQMMRIGHRQRAQTHGVSYAYRCRRNRRESLRHPGDTCTILCLTPRALGRIRFAAAARHPPACIQLEGPSNR